MKATILKISGLFIFLLAVISASAQDRAMISGKIISTEKETVDFATVYLKGTTYGGTTNEQGIYHLKAPAGDYTLVVSAIGYKTVEKPVKLTGGERARQNITITPQSTELDEVVVVSNGISRLKRSAFNAVALDTKELQNSNKSLSEALAKAPGMKVRESGGVGSDMQLTLDGFSGKHVKIIYRRRAAGRCGKFVRAEQHPGQLCRTHRNLQRRGPGRLRYGCNRRRDQHHH